MPDAEPDHDTSMALKDVSDIVDDEGDWEGNASDIISDSAVIIFRNRRAGDGEEKRDG